MENVKNAFWGITFNEFVFIDSKHIVLFFFCGCCCLVRSMHSSPRYFMFVISFTWDVGGLSKCLWLHVIAAIFISVCPCPCPSEIKRESETEYYALHSHLLNCFRLLFICVFCPLWVWERLSDGLFSFGTHFEAYLWFYRMANFSVRWIAMYPFCILHRYNFRWAIWFLSRFQLCDGKWYGERSVEPKTVYEIPVIIYSTCRVAYEILLYFDGMYSLLLCVRIILIPFKDRHEKE